MMTGYRDPPESGRIQKGEIRNPYGSRGKHHSKRFRQKDPIAGLLGDILREKGKVTIDGKVMTMPKLEIYLRKLVQDATAGNAKARQHLQTLMIKFPEALERQIVPSGKITFLHQGVADLTITQILKVHPNMPKEDYIVLKKYFRPPMELANGNII